MDSSYFPMSKSPRKELQGPRPAPLKLRKESYKIKKPPLAPQPVQQQPTQIRPPVIIYAVSPKVIHTNPSDFMNLVQRLTGSTSSSSSSSSSRSSSLPPSTTNHPIFNDTSDAISPAARFATIEKTKSPEGKKQPIFSEENFGFVEGIEMNPGVERTSFFPGILSPGPTSLPPISPNFFSPPSDPNSISFFHDLSPVLHGNKNFLEGSFMPSPSSFNISPYLITSPITPSIDLFNNFFDL
ncbi:nuclear speckle RNA-binding protein B-like [Durio zibethinus]|uniref:Nuclear speckle RNA-binding protein B-like n=1 Tax=Durio zibethinus TaxID=66656 RepID=A0A6P6B5P1_DURZI|nr:nuclear speckle RNA-binding protein B-like [Durio zibethinus]